MYIGAPKLYLIDPPLHIGADYVRPFNADFDGDELEVYQATETKTTTTVMDEPPMEYGACIDCKSTKDVLNIYCRACLDAHPKTEDCLDVECFHCAVRDCPHHEALHYDGGGCPACWDGTKSDESTETQTTTSL